MPSAALPPGFRIRALEGDEDIRRFVELNQAVTREGAICERLIHRRPGASPGDFHMVETGDGRAVSTTCDIRWEILYEDLPLKTVMLEMVVTHPEYRKHGLVRAQIARFHERAQSEGADLCIIQGIPYYYRQYGYGYALDHTRSVGVERAPLGVAGAYRLRAATPKDYPRLAALYAMEMQRQGLSVRRGPEVWAYLAEAAGYPAELLEPPDRGEPVGYVCRKVDGTGTVVSESGLAHPQDAPLLLALAAGPGAVTVGGNPAHPLYRALERVGGVTSMPQQWLLRLPDAARLVRALAPVLSRRLERGGLGDLDAEIVLNFFRNAIRLRIDHGGISEVADAGFRDASLGADGGDLCIAPEAFVRFVFGYRSLEEIRDAWPDTVVRTGSRRIVECLFPRMDSWVLMAY